MLTESSLNVFIIFYSINLISLDHTLYQIFLELKLTATIRFQLIKIPLELEVAIVLVRILLIMLLPRLLLLETRYQL